MHTHTHLAGHRCDVRRRVRGKGRSQRGSNLGLVLLQEQVAAEVRVRSGGKQLDHVLRRGREERGRTEAVAVCHSSRLKT